MPNRGRDWFNQAARDLEQAEDSQQAGRYEWACFVAQQAAEKAVKARFGTMTVSSVDWNYRCTLT